MYSRIWSAASSRKSRRSSSEYICIGGFQPERRVSIISSRSAQYSTNDACASAPLAGGSTTSAARGVTGAICSRLLCFRLSMRAPCGMLTISPMRMTIISHAARSASDESSAVYCVAYHRYSSLRSSSLSLCSEASRRVSSADGGFLPSSTSFTICSRQLR